MEFDRFGASARPAAQTTSTLSTMARSASAPPSRSSRSSSTRCVSYSGLLFFAPPLSQASFLLPEFHCASTANFRRAGLRSLLDSAHSRCRARRTCGCRPRSARGPTSRACCTTSTTAPAPPPTTQTAQTLPSSTVCPRVPSRKQSVWLAASRSGVHVDHLRAYSNRFR